MENMERDILEELMDLLQNTSRDGRILTLNEIERALGPVESEEDFNIEKELDSIEEELDLKIIEDADGQKFYYSGKEMTDKYAGILIRVKDKDVLRLIADTVREESRRYPRPTYVTMFNLQPYGLSEGELEKMLNELSENSDYNDLKFVKASNGVTFIYSEKYMSKGYACYLAEWIEVGQDENP